MKGNLEPNDCRLLTRDDFLLIVSAKVDVIAANQFEKCSMGDCMNIFQFFF